MNFFDPLCSDVANRFARWCVSNQKYQFGPIFGGSAMQDVGIFYDHFVVNT
jgi:hypothetical protein